MDRAILKTLKVLVGILMTIQSNWAQEVVGSITSLKGEHVAGAQIHCGQQIFYSDSTGNFSINKAESEILRISHPHYDQLRINWKQAIRPLKIVLQNNAQELEEIKVIQKKLQRFDIAYLPPIKGVQIATGTNAIIQTQSQQGAKSSGNPRELFAKIPGINIWESDGAGIQMGVGGRGLSPNRAANFNMRQNGYDISADALGYPESYYTPPIEALAAIEIIRGSASLQYGTQFGGLMNFIIQDPVKNSPLDVSTRITTGSFGYFGTFNRISGTNGKWSYQFYHQYKSGNGYRDFSAFKQHQFFGQLNYAISKRQQLRLEYTNMIYDARQPGGLTDVQFKEDVFLINRERNWFGVKWNVAALHYEFEINKSSLFNVRTFAMHSQRYALGWLGKISQVDPGGQRELIAGYFNNIGAEARWLKKYHIRFGQQRHRSAFLIGARYYQGQTTSKQGFASDGDDRDYHFKQADNPEFSNYRFPSKNLSLFSDNIVFLGPKWYLNAGFRLEYIQSASAGYYKQYVIHPLNQDTLGIYTIEGETGLSRTVPLAGAGLTRKLSSQTVLYGNYCLNYRAINFNDIRVSNPNVLVDTNIRDEYGYTAELGFRGLITRDFYIDLAAFYLFYGDKIGLAPEENGTRKIRSNIGDAVNKGIELYAEWDFIKTFVDSSNWSSSIFANISFIDAHYIRSTERNYIGKRIEYVSTWVQRFGLKFKYKNWAAQIQYSYNSGQYADATNAFEPSADAIIGYIPAYQVLDFSLRGELPKGFQLEAGINNLLNTKYFTRRATAYPGPGILPSDGRSFYVTIQYHFKK